MSVDRDYAQAREWYQKAADAGNNVAMRNLGVLYEKGSGVAQDYAKAREWYQKAAEAGNAMAMKNLGRLIQQPSATPEFLPLSKVQNSADSGNSNAMYELGWMYESGHGVAQDYAKAREWYQKAADAGNIFAKQALARLDSK